VVLAVGLPLPEGVRGFSFPEAPEEAFTVLDALMVCLAG
jgi:hypothetical protein